MKQEYPQFAIEDRLLVRILPILIWASWGTYLVVFISSLYWDDWRLAVTTLLSGVFLTVPFWLLKRGYLLASGYTFVLMVLGMVTIAATIGQGIHDIAILAYPGIIIFASLSLNRVGFKIYVLLVLASMGWLVFGEASGLFISEVIQTPGWIDYLIIATLLLVVALTVNLLATNMRMGLEQAQQEIAQRKQAEEALRASEERYRELFEAESDSIFLIDNVTGGILEANRAAAALYGYSPEELLSIRDVDLSAKPEEIQKGIHGEAIMSGEVVTIPLRHHRKKDGTVFPVEITGRFFTQQGQSVRIAAIRDITERKQAQEAARENEERNRTLVASLSVGVLLQGPNAEIILSNEKALELLGFTEDQLLGKTSIDPDWNVIHEDGTPFPGPTHPVHQAITTRRPVRDALMGVYRPTTKDRVWLLVNADPLLNPDGSVRQVICTFADITKRKHAEEALQESEKRFKLSMDATNDGLWDWDIKTNGCYFSPGYYRMLGYEADDFPANGSAWSDLIHPDDQKRTMQANMDCIEGLTEQFEVEYRMKAKDENWRWILGRGKCIERDEQGRAIRLLGTHVDITERKQAEEQLRYQGTHDALTGIYNRAFFEVELARLGHSRAFPTSIIMADVDKLKVTNDTRGHAAGDALLRHVANILGSVFREGDVLARIGGDEFAILLPNTNAETAEQMLARVKNRLMKHNAEHSDLPMQLSLGTATAEKSNLTTAFTLADQRMYEDKVTHKANANY